MKEVAQVTAEDLVQGVKRERLLFALVLLVEWHQSFKNKQRDLRRKYKEAFATPGRTDQSARIQVS
jgi:hypothetical protein